MLLGRIPDRSSSHNVWFVIKLHASNPSLSQKPRVGLEESLLEHRRAKCSWSVAVFSVVIKSFTPTDTCTVPPGDIVEFNHCKLS
jgi:hypothetical protein